MTLGTILIIILILLLIGAIPNWGYSRGWGYGPSGGLGLVLVVVPQVFVAPTRQGTTGLGLAGMASRVENLGGSLRARADDDRWLVDARFCAAPTTSSGCVIDEALSGR